MDDKKLFVASLPFSMDDTALNELFAPFGTVAEARVATDKFSGKSKGFGFVTMGSAEEAQAAIKALDGSDVNGRQLVVNVAKPREDKPRGSFGGGSGGGYRGGNGGGGYGARDSGSSNRW
jgi:RNA recognition motif-containing protein